MASRPPPSPAHHHVSFSTNFPNPTTRTRLIIADHWQGCRDITTDIAVNRSASNWELIKVYPGLVQLHIISTSWSITHHWWTWLPENTSTCIGKITLLSSNCGKLFFGMQHTYPDMYKVTSQNHRLRQFLGGSIPLSVRHKHNSCLLFAPVGSSGHQRTQWI